ncbi:MAG: hypothetical protein R3D88_03370 [Alphaproteobacteria bacterium]|nr:hypothetical protein [Alphaproteobacteria bacterium]
MNDDTDLNKILEKRLIVPPSTNLASRIITAATPRMKAPLWVLISREVEQMFFLPRPAYALAFSLVLGIFLGIYGETETSLSLQNWFSFIDGSSDLVGEDWL